MAVNLVNRVQKILLSPQSEWDVIDKEPADVQGILTTYVAPLVILPAIIALILSFLLIGGLIGITGLLVMTLVGIALSIALVYVMALIVDALAPSFGGQKNFGQAFKLVAYSGTAMWVASLFAVLPVIGFIIAWAGIIYSAILLFLGLPKLMKPPADKSIVYAIVVIVIMAVLVVVIGMIQTRVMMSFMTSLYTMPYGGMQVTP